MSRSPDVHTTFLSRRWLRWLAPAGAMALAATLVSACSGDGSGPGQEAAQLAFTTQPSSSLAGQVITPATQRVLAGAGASAVRHDFVASLVRTLWFQVGVFLLSFLLMFALPGKPARAATGQELAGGATPEQLAEAATSRG